MQKIPRSSRTRYGNTGFGVSNRNNHQRGRLACPLGVILNPHLMIQNVLLLIKSSHAMACITQKECLLQMAKSMPCALTRTKTFNEPWVICMEDFLGCEPVVQENDEYDRGGNDCPMRKAAHNSCKNNQTEEGSVRSRRVPSSPEIGWFA